MNVGYAQAVITPSLDKPVFLAGFGNNRRAVSIHDDLYVRALAVEDGQNLLVLAALDLIGFFRHDAYDVIRRVHESRPDVQVLLASVHPHHGPDTIGLWGRTIRRPAWTGNISRQQRRRSLRRFSLRCPRSSLLLLSALRSTSPALRRTPATPRSWTMS